MPRKQSTTPPNVLEDDPTETLSPDEEAAVTAEANATDADKVVLPEEQQQQPPAEATPEEASKAPLTEREGFPEETTPAQKRIQALIEERDRERQEKTQLLERWARLDEKKKVIEEAGRQAQEEAARREKAAQRPDPDIDPVGARLWDQEQRLAQYEQERAQERQAYQQWLQAQQQQTEQQRLQTQIENWRVNEEAATKASHPDYGDAVDFLHKKRVEHWRMMGNNPQEAEDMWLRERFAYMAQTKYNQDRGSILGPTFGEVVYKLATDLGYRPNGTAAPAAPATNGGVNRLEQLKAAQQRQGLGGKTSPASGTDEIASIGAMDAHQFLLYLDQFKDGEDYVALQRDNPQKWAAIQKRMTQIETGE